MGKKIQINIRKIKDELETFSLSETGTYVQVAVQEKGPTVIESFLILKFQRIFLVLVLESDWQWLWKIVFVRKDFLDPLYLNDFIKPVTSWTPLEAVIWKLISRGSVPRETPCVTQPLLKIFWDLPAGFEDLGQLLLKHSHCSPQRTQMEQQAVQKFQALSATAMIPRDHEINSDE